MPLHSLVVTLFQLAQCGCKGEGLFGAVAVLLCLLSLGVKPRLKCFISLPALFGEAGPGHCGHEEFSPIELAERVPTRTAEIWDFPAQTGWRLYCYVLCCSDHEWMIHPLDHEEEDQCLKYRRDMYSGYCEKRPSKPAFSNGFHGDCCEHLNLLLPPFFGESTCLGHIWVTIQTELLSYRRLTEEDPWTFGYFNMECLLNSLESGQDVAIKYVQGRMMFAYCRCGRFSDGALNMSILKTSCGV